MSEKSCARRAGASPIQWSSAITLPISHKTRKTLGSDYIGQCCPVEIPAKRRISHGIWTSSQWVNRFVARHAEQIRYTTIRPQKDPRFQVALVYVGHHIDLVTQHVVQARSLLVYKIDEIGCSDWEEPKSSRGFMNSEAFSG
jgi:hypothetical protein